MSYYILISKAIQFYPTAYLNLIGSPLKALSLENVEQLSFQVLTKTIY